MKFLLPCVLSGLPPVDDNKVGESGQVKRDELFCLIVLRLSRDSRALLRSRRTRHIVLGR